MSNYLSSCQRVVTLLLLWFSISALAASKPLLRDPFTPYATMQQITAAKQLHTTLLLPIYYAKAVDLAKFINDSTMHLLSATGTIKAYQRTNHLWIEDTKQNIARIKQLIAQLDRPSEQIVIKARIVNIDNQYAHALGINFQSFHDSTTHRSNQQLIQPTATFLATTTLPIIKFHGKERLDLQLQALEQAGYAHIISAPKLITLNRQTASIASGEEIPYQQQTAHGGTSIIFKKATLDLTVTPILMPHKKILLHLTLHQDKLSNTLIQNTPTIITQQIKTSVIVANGETVVLGGIYEQYHYHQKKGVLFLQKIPLLGLFFKHRKTCHEKKELLIFITPTKIVTLQHHR